MLLFSSIRPCHHLPLRRFLCRSSAPDLAPYRESFARRMAMAGIKPHHRIAIGVSGGPDSMALCVLAAGWKSDGPDRDRDVSGCVDGLLGIVVDHRLRPESGEEARLVRERVTRMGIRCEIKCCNWEHGKPKQGRVQEAARDMRYQIFQDVCFEQQIGILLIAQHADDQTELFVLRMSRKSGVFGLAGMAFVSQLFSTLSNCNSEGNQSILLVRPMLELSKDDMYNICRGSCKEWVEDPTNQSQLYARNRLRMSLRSVSSSGFKSDMQRLITACRLTRSFVENICYKMIKHSVTIADCGYASIDLEKLKPSEVEDLCLSKFLTMLLQFISQRHKPIRGSVSQLLLHYIRGFPCKTSLAVAGCHLCPAPGSKGSKVLVCCSLDTLQSLGTPFWPKCGNEPPLPRDIDDIIMSAQSHSDQSILKASSIYFLHSKSSDDILSEAKRMNLISESTFTSIHLMEKEENKNFTSKSAVEPDHDSRHEIKLGGESSLKLHYGQSCHFMERFLVTWKHYKDTIEHRFTLKNTDHKSGDSRDHLCELCMSQEKTLVVRHMVDADWLYLAELSKNQAPEDGHDGAGDSVHKLEHSSVGIMQSSDYVHVSARKALQALKSIPASARRSLPVIVNSQDLLLSIPSICFSCCPLLSVAVVFRPRVPLGGGYSSYI